MILYSAAGIIDLRLEAADGDFHWQHRLRYRGSGVELPVLAGRIRQTFTGSVNHHNRSDLSRIRGRIKLQIVIENRASSLSGKV